MISLALDEGLPWAARRYQDFGRKLECTSGKIFSILQDLVNLFSRPCKISYQPFSLVSGFVEKIMKKIIFGAHAGTHGFWRENHVTRKVITWHFQNPIISSLVCFWGAYIGFLPSCARILSGLRENFLRSVGNPIRVFTWPSC